MEYIINRETQKLELHFSKEEYQALPESSKDEIKSAFLFSRRSGAWVSRAKQPNLWRAEAIAKKLGADFAGKTGEALSFAEQMERKAERAEARAERYDTYAANAHERGANLQKPLDDMRGDIAFFTQPNINSSAGRAFTRQRERMFAAYDRGFEEFKKSEYFADRADAARQTAAQTRPTDKAFCFRRIRDAQKTIRAQRENLAKYEKRLEQLDAGEPLRLYSGEPLTRETVEGWIESASEQIDAAISKEIYYRECLEDLGGVTFSRENIKKGMTVQLAKYHEQVKVLSTGTVNFTYLILTGGAAGMSLKASYAEIEKIVSEQAEPEPAHPYKVGDRFTVRRWNSTEHRYKPAEFEVIRATDKSVTLKTGDEKPIVRKPRRHQTRGETGAEWYLSITDSYDGTVCKKGA